MKRRTFSREFKLESVKLVTERGVAVDRLASALARCGACQGVGGSNRTVSDPRSRNAAL